MRVLFLAVKNSFKEVWGDVLISRIIFFILLVFSSFVVTEEIPSREGFNFHFYSTVSSKEALDHLIKTLLAGDPSWYMEISKYGYPSADYNVPVPKHWVFFPAFPILVRGLSFIFGSFVFSALILNLFLFLLGICFLNEFLRDSVSDTTRKFAIRAIAFHPLSYFFSLPQTEALFLFGLAGSLLLLSQKQYGFSQILVTSLMICSRPTGILVLPALIYFLPTKLRIELFFKRMMLALIPLFLFCLHLYFKTGSSLAWLFNQNQWRNSSGTSIFSLFSFDFFSPWNFNLFHLCSFLLVIAALFYLFRTKQRMMFLILFVPFLGVCYSGSFFSFSRIVMPLFPLYIFIGQILGSEDNKRFYLFVSAFFYGVLALLFCARVTMAMA